MSHYALGAADKTLSNRHGDLQEVLGSIEAQTRELNAALDDLIDEVRKGNMEDLMLDLGDIEPVINIAFRKRFQEPDSKVHEEDRRIIEFGIEKMHIRLLGKGGVGSLLTRGWEHSRETGLVFLRYYILQQCKGVAVLTVAHKRLGQDFDSAYAVGNMDEQARLFCHLDIAAWHPTAAPASIPAPAKEEGCLGCAVAIGVIFFLSLFVVGGLGIYLSKKRTY
jgi:hypothetical protein